MFRILKLKTQDSLFFVKMMLSTKRKLQQNIFHSLRPTHEDPKLIFLPLLPGNQIANFIQTFPFLHFSTQRDGMMELVQTYFLLSFSFILDDLAGKVTNEKHQLWRSSFCFKNTKKLPSTFCVREVTSKS